MSDDERKEALQDLMLAQADVFYRPKDISIDLAIEALENQKSIVEELEKIKAKMCGLKGDNKQSRCNNCQNNTDELSGECYECVKGIEDWYEPIEENEERYITAEEYMKTGKWIGE